MHAWVIGNWKQHPATKAQAVSLVNDVCQNLAQASQSKQRCQVMLIPTHLHLDAVATVLADSQSTVAQPSTAQPIQLGVQDISSHADSIGAFTGDCSAGQAKDLGASWTLVGHSERRQYHHEDNAQLCDKIRRALSANLGVILCVGESLADYDNGSTEQTLVTQLTVFDDLTAEEMTQLSKALLIAYEPVWAIGTGKVPTLDEVNTVHGFIKSHLVNAYPSLEDTSILYGGSVNENNASEFASSEWVNGVLVGGASLVAEKFVQIAHAFST